MEKRITLIVGALAVAVVMAIGAGVAVSASGDDDKPLEGSDFDRATQAALQHVGEGTVTETEVGDDGAAYGVEIRLDDGSQVEVELDRSFDVIGSAPDDDGSNDDDAGGNDD